MFKKLIEKISNLTRTPEPVNPERFEDPIAMKTQWTPAKGGGSNFCTHRLVRISPDRIEFRVSIGAKIFYMIFLLAGLGIMIGFSYHNFSEGTFKFSVDIIMPMSIGLIFAAVGGCLLYFGTVPVVFDKRERQFWKGRRSPREVFDPKSLKYFAEIDQIHALQLISEYCRGDKSSYYSYELNLVLEDGKRINVVDHGNVNKIHDQAATLAEFLRKPVWDAI